MGLRGDFSGPRVDGVDVVVGRIAVGSVADVVFGLIIGTVLNTAESESVLTRFAMEALVGVM
jgi:hypothetical protein